MRDAGIKGEVIVEVTVDRYNNVSEPRVIKSDHAELDLLALEAVLGWEYEAAIINGQMVKSRLPVTVKFDPAVKPAKKAKQGKTRRAGSPTRISRRNTNTTSHRWRCVSSSPCIPTNC